MTFLSAVPILSTLSCAGAQRLTDGHLAYNEAVRRAADQELLLNIVRLRYLDSVEFLATTSIHSTISFSVGVDASVGHSGGRTSSSAGIGARYSSTPTFSFVPQRGEDFGSRLTEPVDLDTLVLLVSANRDAHTLFRLVVSWMNGLDNREGSVDEDFIEATRQLTEMQLKGYALVGFRGVERVVTPPMPADQVSPSAMLQAYSDGLKIESHADGREIVFTTEEQRPTLYLAEDAPGRDSLANLLKLDRALADFPIEERSQSRAPDASELPAIWLETRSLLHAMAFLSQGIDVPSEHVASGLVSTVWPHPAIESVPMDDLFRVYSSVEEPEDAALAVKHRGFWFYIKDTDHATKRTFFMITEAFRLAFEHDTSRAPILTLSTGSG